jgi:hypothetical protein
VIDLVRAVRPALGKIVEAVLVRDTAPGAILVEEALGAPTASPHPGAFSVQVVGPDPDHALAWCRLRDPAFEERIFFGGLDVRERHLHVQAELLAHGLAASGSVGIVALGLDTCGHAQEVRLLAVRARAAVGGTNSVFVHLLVAVVAGAVTQFGHGLAFRRLTASASVRFYARVTCRPARSSATR